MARQDINPVRRDVVDELEAAMNLLRHDVARETYAAQWAVARFEQAVRALRLRDHMPAPSLVLLPDVADQPTGGAPSRVA